MVRVRLRARYNKAYVCTRKTYSNFQKCKEKVLPQQRNIKFNGDAIIVIAREYHHAFNNTTPLPPGDKFRLLINLQHLFICIIGSVLSGFPIGSRSQIYSRFIQHILYFVTYYLYYFTTFRCRLFFAFFQLKLSMLSFFMNYFIFLKKNSLLLHLFRKQTVYYIRRVFLKHRHHFLFIVENLKYFNNKL